MAIAEICLEVCIRFGAFERKRRAFMDKWFVFDAILVLNMVVETWLLPILILTSSSDDLGNTIDVSMLRMLRLVKLTRLSRITRLLRAVPELAIIVKAIGLSARSVTVFFALWLVLIYVFAITLRQLTSGTDFGQSYFSSVPDAMDTLLLDGILADYAPLAHAVPNGHPIEWILIIFFVLLASITIMYMLVGVLVEVVGALAHAEQLGSGWDLSLHRCGRRWNKPGTMRSPS
ncbi:Dual specificity protein phosphatase 9 [Durusdinium trenchii]|uniref:Dual specificity protein phosphatase 9 n=1 Tax=Durusdinium trenchii TaxID=1381693 RepID=A0ABP0MQ98_9DINO